MYASYTVTPKYEPTDHFFVVTLPNVKWNETEVDETVNDTVNEPVSETEMQVLNCFKATMQLRQMYRGSDWEVAGNRRLSASRIAYLVTEIDCSIYNKI